MKKIIYILLFSAVFGVIFMFVMFLSANIFYNINNGICFYHVDFFFLFLKI